MDSVMNKLQCFVTAAKHV